MIPIYNSYFFGMPFLPNNCTKPPTIYSILESIVNPSANLNEPSADIKIKDLSKYGRTTIFNFDYPLSNNISKEKFECMILNHFLMRRIGFETVTAFRIQLNVKLNEIMPIYNKMFDSFINWNIFDDGEITQKTGSNNTETQSEQNSTNNLTNNTENNVSNNSTTESENTSDRRNSDTPQNRLEDIRNGNYVTDYKYDTNNATSSDISNSEARAESTTNSTNNTTNNSTDNNNYNETITKTQHNKMELYKEMQENIKSIYSMIFKDLECLFYQLI